MEMKMNTYPEQRKDPLVHSVSYQYSTVDRIKDAIAACIMAATFFVFTWIAFAMDAITTGM
jgi:hypothetical protein